MTHNDQCMSTVVRTCNLPVHFLNAPTEALKFTLIPLSSIVNWLMGTVRIFGWLVWSPVYLN